MLRMISWLFPPPPPPPPHFFQKMAIRGTTSDVQCRRLPPAVTGLFGVTPILSSVSLLFLVSLPVNVQALGAPTGLTVTAEGDSSISLAWTAPADDDGGAIEGYNVYRCDESSSSDCSVFPWLAWVAVPGNTEYTDTTVAAGTTYRYAVAAYRGGDSDWSNEVTATARTPTAPGAPGTLEGQATAAKVVLTWAGTGE